MHLAEIVEDAHEIAFRQPSSFRIVRMHQQLDVGARQLAERRADCPLARGRNEGQRISVGRRIGLKPVEADWRARLERARKQIHFAIRSVWKHVDELNRRPAKRRRWLHPGAQILADSVGQRVEHAHQQLELVLRLVRSEHSKARPQLAKHVGVRSRLADGVDNRPRQIEVNRAVRLREVVALQKRRRRQHDVGVQRRVGHDLLENHGE